MAVYFFANHTVPANSAIELVIIEERRCCGASRLTEKDLTAGKVLYIERHVYQSLYIDSLDSSPHLGFIKIHIPLVSLTATITNMHSDNDDSATIVLLTRDVNNMSMYAATDVFRKPQSCTATTPFTSHSAKSRYFTEIRENI